MLSSDNRYTKLRWLLTFSGSIMYTVDIWTDVGLAAQYFKNSHFIWAGLTVLFVLAGLLVTQIFSYVWYRDDMNDVMGNPEGVPAVSGMSGRSLVFLHLFGLGMFTRYYHLLKKGFAVVWKKTSDTEEEETNAVHQSLFGLATDLSMLKLFEAFLESVPQLLLQLYITLGLEQISILQCISMAFSFFNIAWSLVDYRRCLRRSLPHVREMPSGLPTLVYLLYKLCTITSHILSYALLLILSTYSAVVLALIWLLATGWTHFLHTKFCSCRSLEWFYRAVVGVILMFTFFNVKGQDTKIVMSVYYVLYSAVSILTPILISLLMPEMQSALVLTVSGVIFGGMVLGLVFLMIYYVHLHPRGKWQEEDELDGLAVEAQSTLRIRRFIQP